MILSPIEIRDIRERRRALAREFDEIPSGVVMEAGATPGSRVFRPAAARSPLTVVYVHGGGWIAGDVDTHAGACARLAIALDCEVVAVQFRRPPESLWPHAVDDVVRALESLGAAGPLVVAGDATGAHIAVEAAIRGSQALHALILFQPVVDPALSTSSWDEHEDEWLSRSRMRSFWEAYFGAGKPVSIANLDIATLPPTAIVVSDDDPLADEGRLFAGRLAAASVPCEVFELGRHPHGALNLARKFPAAQHVLPLIRAWLQAIPHQKVTNL